MGFFFPLSEPQAAERKLNRGKKKTDLPISARSAQGRFGTVRFRALGKASERVYQREHRGGQIAAHGAGLSPDIEASTSRADVCARAVKRAARAYSLNWAPSSFSILKGDKHGIPVPLHASGIIILAFESGCDLS